MTHMQVLKIFSAKLLSTQKPLTFVGTSTFQLKLYTVKHKHLCKKKHPKGQQSTLFDQRFSVKSQEFNKPSN